MNAATMVIETRECFHCHKFDRLEVPIYGYQRWKSGELIQNAFPNLSASDRELLISGIHSKCWDEAFSKDSDREG
ncbi:hypothetical protein CL620_06305 [archaeon]|jgi:hypothetical protein|nr:hypothetical protein [archaeon]